MPEVRKIKYLKAEEVESLIRKARGFRNKAVLAVMYQCGLRRGEIELLTRDSYVRHAGRFGMLKVVRLKQGELVEREVPLWKRTARRLVRYLRRRRDHDDAMFRSRKGGAMTPQAVYYVYRKAAKRARLSPDMVGKTHALRHSVATHMMAMGSDVADVQEHLGHRDIGSTMVYARVLNPRKIRTASRAEASHHFAMF